MRHECRVFKPQEDGSLILKKTIAPKPVFTKKEQARLKAMENPKTQNSKNKSSWVTGSHFKGVYFRADQPIRPWKAQPWCLKSKKLVCLGMFSKELAAAQAVADFKGCTVEDLRK